MSRKTTRISSPQNDQLKSLLKLRERKGRRQQGQFIVEGWREIERALACGFALQRLAFREDADESLANRIEAISGDFGLFAVAATVWPKLAMREQTVVAVAAFSLRSYEIAELNGGEAGFWLIADGLEKPGNLGAILRSCDGAGARGLILTNSIVDPFNPNSIRASQGAVFKVPTVEMTVAEIADWAKNMGVSIYAADPKGAEITHGNLFAGKKWAFVIGNEAEGISAAWKNVAAPIKLPMHGVCDSLNASVTAGVLLYEALRQTRL